MDSTAKLDNNTDGKQDLKYWVTELSGRQMPAFAHTAQAIAGQVQDDNSSTAHLAREILQDPSMTARVLKMSNNVFHNPSQSRISTVSRAIVVLGFATVRRICMSIAFIDSLLKNKPKDNMMKALARSFHAATLAHMLAEKRGDKNPEEVYIATLLYHLGNLVFWCFANDFDPNLYERLHNALAGAEADTSDIEQRILGFSLKELSAALNREWQLSDLLEFALESKLSKDKRLGNLTMGYELADAIQKGWDSPEVKKLIKRTAELLYMPQHKAEAVIKEKTEQACRTLSSLGAGRVNHLIPRPPQPVVSASGVLQPDTQLPDSGEALEQQPETGKLNIQQEQNGDMQLQLTILGEISEHLEEGSNITLLLEMVLEGIHRGIGMDRTLFALLTPDRTGLHTKLALGKDRDQISKQFSFRMDQPGQIRNLITQQRGLLIDPSQSPWDKRLATDPVGELCRGQIFFISPIIVNRKIIGVFYADRAVTGRKMDKACFHSFKLFVQQASMGLSHCQSRSQG